LITLNNVPDPAQFCGRIFNSLAIVVDVPGYPRPFCMASLPTDIAKSIGSNREGFDTFPSDGDRWSAKLLDLLCILISNIRIPIVVVVVVVVTVAVLVVVAVAAAAVVVLVVMTTAAIAVVVVAIVIIFDYCL